jgi:hypothetical protein
VTHRLDAKSDVEEVRWLLRLSQAIHHLARGAGREAELHAVLEKLDPPATVADAVERDVVCARAAAG